MERRHWIGVRVAVLVTLVMSISAVASASTVKGSTSFPSGCKKAVFTGDGGYYSMGQFYWEPGDDVTVTTDWCYSDHVITSKNVSYTTTIPTSFHPQITESDSLGNGGAVLNVQINGDYDSGVGNNVGFITLVGHVNARGRHKFHDDSGAGG
jgi:hypothetical protein